MFERILVPLDGSKRAERILPAVRSLAKTKKADIVLLQVVEPEIRFAGLETGHVEAAVAAFREQTKAAEEYLQCLQGEFRDQGIRAIIRISHGTVVESILQTAQDMNADLIAMASHGRSGLARVFYGSVAAGVLNRTDRALLLVRAENDEG